MSSTVVVFELHGLGMQLFSVCGCEMHLGGPEKGLCFYVCGSGMWLVVVLFCCCGSF